MVQARQLMPGFFYLAARSVLKEQSLPVIEEIFSAPLDFLISN